MQITNISGVDRDLPALGRVIAAGETFDVADDLATSLLDQPANWAAPTTKPAKSEE